MVSTTVVHVILWITTHLPTSYGRKAELAWFADPQRTVYPQSGHLSTCQTYPDLRVTTRRRGKVRQPKTDVITTEPRSHDDGMEKESLTENGFKSILKERVDVI